MTTPTDIVFQKERPLEPQLEDLFSRRHGQTVPAVLREMARRIDELQRQQQRSAFHT